MKTIFRYLGFSITLPVAPLLLLLSALTGSAQSRGYGAYILGSHPPDAPELPATSPTPKLDDPASWVPKANGCLIEQIGSSIRIVGTNNINGRGNGNSITTTRSLPAGDFYATVDFMVPQFFMLPQFSGPGSSLVYLRAKSTTGDGKMVAIQYLLTSPGTYQLQTWGVETAASTLPVGEVRTARVAWLNAQRDASPLPKFGDEDRVFHRMKLKYDAAAGTAAGWVDDQFIGSRSLALTNPVTFELLADTETKGMKIDVLFSNLNFSSSISEAPPTPPTNWLIPPDISAAPRATTDDVNLAREALIALFQTRDSFLVPRLADTSNPPANLGGGVVQVGPARVNLQNRSWTLDWVTSASSAHYQGRFRVNAKGEWTAQMSGFQEGLRAVPRP
jgi:hypothetical protein